jgi:hypothetical protein
LGIGFIAAQEPNRRQNGGFARTRFAGEDVQPLAERNFGAIDEDEVFNPKIF